MLRNEIIGKKKEKEVRGRDLVLKDKIGVIIRI